MSDNVTSHKTKAYVASLTNKWRWTERLHYYDATGRLLKSSYSAYYAGDTPTISSLEHVYAGSRHVQNYDNVSSYGAVWHWAGAQHEHQAPLKSPNADTASQQGFNLAASMGNAADQQRPIEST